MADTTPVADTATLPSLDDIARVAAFTREPFSTEGDDGALLTPGTPHRAAFDAALAEVSAGGASGRCCWGWSGCSPRTSRRSPTAPCSRPTRSTRCPAR